MQQRQCEKCPWKRTTNPRTIPGGYDEAKHATLRRTIAEPGDPWATLETLRIMACHESPERRERPCVGWLHNQLHEGNNLALRWAVIRRRVSGEYELDGEQHAVFEDTLP